MEQVGFSHYEPPASIGPARPGRSDRATLTVYKARRHSSRISGRRSSPKNAKSSATLAVRTLPGGPVAISGYSPWSNDK
jgi:hypothetical protein